MVCDGESRPRGGKMAVSWPLPVPCGEGGADPKNPTKLLSATRHTADEAWRLRGLPHEIKILVIIFHFWHLKRGTPHVWNSEWLRLSFGISSIYFVAFGLGGHAVYQGQPPVCIIWKWDDGNPVRYYPRCGCPRNNIHYHQYTECMTQSKNLARRYNIVRRPSRQSRHVEGLAVDMTIAWTGNLAIRTRNGATVAISTTPRNGDNIQLHAIGASYEVYKLLDDTPHWSSDGR